MTDRTTIGQNIAALRKEAGLTQTELADRLHVSHQAVSQWERGETLPDILTLPALAEIFGQTAGRLLGMEETPPAEKTHPVEKSVETHIPLSEDCDYTIVLEKDGVRVQEIPLDLQKQIAILLDGNCQNLTCFFSLVVEGSVEGDAAIDGSIEGDCAIGGDATIGGSIGGDISIHGQSIISGNVEGDLEVQADSDITVTIQGDVIGDVYCGELNVGGNIASDVDCGTLTVGGDIAGDVDCGSLTVNGSIAGDVDCGSLEVHGDINGDVDCGNCHVEGNINGDVE